MDFFATCPKGFEHLLARELAALGTPRTRPLQGQVAFAGELVDAYRVCLWSHLASRVIAVVGRIGAKDADELYASMSEIAWENHVPSSASFAVDASGSNAQLRNTQFTAMRAKDAIVDRMRARTGTRAQVNPKNPDVGVVVRVSRERATVGIDLCGAPLFNRGYERAKDTHTLRPDYAAALLSMGSWRELCEGIGSSGGSGDAPDNGASGVPTLLDCSSRPNTLLVEAALMAAHRAPGLLRLRWGFTGWAGHDSAAWKTLVQEAQSQAEPTFQANLLITAPQRARSAIRSNLRAAGLESDVRFFAPQADASTNADKSAGAAGAGSSGGVDLLACDLSDLFADDLAQEASALTDLAGVVRTQAPARTVCATRDELVQRYLGAKPADVVQGMLGRDPLYLQSFGTPDQSWASPAQIELAQGEQVAVLVPASDQFAARLKKVARLRGKWAKREDVSCYRVYDSDLPDYAVCIDLYQGSDPATGELNGRRWLQVSEYAAPKDIDPVVAKSRLVDVLTIAPRLLDVDPRNCFLRVRRRDKGGSQYAQEARGQQGGNARGDKREGRRGDRRQGPGGKLGPNGMPALPKGAHLIDEGGLVFEVNFSTRLDCGIFLDHRETRAMLREMAKQTKGSKRFLNLFAYTGTATCYAADGGAKHTTTVDLSLPSLDWARRNMARNGFVGREHEFVQADVIRWISEQRHTPNRWDLIFCDVPTFSNSSRMGKRSFDVQRDHAELLIGLSRLLTRDGTAVFSCNLRTFKPDVQKLAKAGVVLEDITDKTIPEDFQRNKRIHHAYIVRRG